MNKSIFNVGVQYYSQSGLKSRETKGFVFCVCIILVINLQNSSVLF